MFNKFLFVTATILSCSFCFAQNNISFIKGKKINKVSTIQTKSSSEMMGQTMEQNIITTSWSEIVITEVFDNEIKVEDKGTKIKMKMEAMGQEMEYDSDKPNENENFKKAGDLLNKVTNITANFQGLITSIKYDATMEQQIK